jgi:septum site-determining protein MinC
MPVAAPVTPSNGSSIFELKSATLTLVAVVVKTTDLGQLARALDDRFADAPGLFDNDPVAIDLAPLRESTETLDIAALVQLLASHRMRPVAVKGGNAQQMADALAAGLAEAQGSAAPRAANALQVSSGADTAAAREAAPPAAMPAAPRGAMIVDKPLRSGQRVYAKGTDLIVLAHVSFGAEVIADGNIHVYAPLRGRALAGAMGDTTARIITTCMEPQLLSIAGVYRTTEHELAPEVLGKPAQVRLDGEKLVVVPLTF